MRQILDGLAILVDVLLEFVADSVYDLLHVAHAGEFAVWWIWWDGWDIWEIDWFLKLIVVFDGFFDFVEIWY